MPLTIELAAGCEVPGRYAGRHAPQLARERNYATGLGTLSSSHHHITFPALMRTTLDIDDDLVAALKQIAARNKTSAGRAASTLLRDALTGRSFAIASKKTTAGFLPLPRGSRIVTDDDVNRLRDQIGV